MITPYARKAFWGIVLWYIMMVVGFAFDNPLWFYVSLTLALVATVMMIAFIVEGK